MPPPHQVPGTYPKRTTIQAVLFSAMLLSLSGCGGLFSVANPQGGSHSSGSTVLGAGGGSLHSGLNLISPAHMVLNPLFSNTTTCWPAFLVELDDNLNPIPFSNSSSNVSVQDESGDASLYVYDPTKLRQACHGDGLGSLTVSAQPGTVWRMFYIDATQAGSHTLTVTSDGVTNDSKTVTVTASSSDFLVFFGDTALGAQSGDCNEVTVIGDYGSLGQSTTFVSRVPGVVLYADSDCLYPIYDGVKAQADNGYELATFYVQADQLPIPLLLDDSSGVNNSLSAVMVPSSQMH